jgi:hypothetical protein
MNLMSWGGVREYQEINKNKIYSRTYNSSLCFNEFVNI